MRNDLPSHKPAVDYGPGLEDFSDSFSRLRRPTIELGRMGKSFPEKVFNCAGAMLVIVLLISFFVGSVAALFDAFKPTAVGVVPTLAPGEPSQCRCRAPLSFQDYLTNE